MFYVHLTVGEGWSADSPVLLLDRTLLALEGSLQLENVRLESSRHCSETLAGGPCPRFRLIQSGMMMALISCSISMPFASASALSVSEQWSAREKMKLAQYLFCS